MKASKIEWTHSTFNPWWGCERVSPGCAHCYAEAFAKRTGHPVWGGTAPRRFFGDAHWREPLKWNAEAAKSGEPWRVFCASMADVFEDRADLVPHRRRVFDLIGATTALTWLVLTKRPENVPSMMREIGLMLPGNVWLGTTVEDQERADERIPHLLNASAGTRFLSVEPLLERVNLHLGRDTLDTYSSAPRIDWVIVGGESGAGARPCEIAWLRDVRIQCAEASVPCLVKQTGVRPVYRSPYDMSDDAYMAWDSKHAGEPFPDDGVIVRPFDGKGGDWTEWPEDLRVREYPK